MSDKTAYKNHGNTYSYAIGEKDGKFFIQCQTLSGGKGNFLDLPENYPTREAANCAKAIFDKLANSTVAIRENKHMIREAINLLERS